MALFDPTTPGCDGRGLGVVYQVLVLARGTDAVFYIVLRKGYGYTFQWMYYFGGKETFVAWRVPASSPKQVHPTIAIDPKGHGRVVPAQPAPTASAQTARATLTERTAAGMAR